MENINENVQKALDFISDYKVKNNITVIKSDTEVAKFVKEFQNFVSDNLSFSNPEVDGSILAYSGRFRIENRSQMQ